jgi:SAM-dependent methyltransferase
MNQTDMPAEFGLYSAYYDLLYRDKDYAAEADYVAQSLSRVVPEHSHVLELGCGTGIHAELLARKGFHVTGVERSESMYSQAVVRANALQSSECPGSFLPMLSTAQDFRCDGKFDAVISLFHVLSYQTDAESIDRFFETVVRHLKHGGVFLFDVWYGPAVLTLKPSVRVKRMRSENLEVVRIAEPGIDTTQSIVNVHYQIFARSQSDGNFQSVTEGHSMRYFFATEIHDLARKYSMRCIFGEEWMSRLPLSEETWGACFLLRKN